MAKGSSQTQETQISDVLAGPSADIANQIAQFTNVNPWDLEYTGPRVAAMNDAQKQALDMPSVAGNAYNMGFTPASASLPQSTNINGMETYDVLGLAKQGISPQLQSMLDQMFGGLPQAAPSTPRGGQVMDMFFGDPMQTGLDKNGETTSGFGVLNSHNNWMMGR